MRQKYRLDPDVTYRQEQRRHERDPNEEQIAELELADRIAEHGSRPPGDIDARDLARHRLGRGPTRYEQPQDPAAAAAYEAGDRVTHQEPDGANRRGQVVKSLPADNLVVVAFDAGTTVVEASRLKREAA